MNKKIACFLALSIVSTGLIAMLPTGTAQTYGGSVMTSDGSDPPNYKDYFDLWENVFYHVYATYNSLELQYADIDIEISGPNGIIWTDTVTTDEYGRVSDNWGGWNIVGEYTIYANYSTNEIDNQIFMIYDPIPKSATVTTYADNPRESGGRPAYYYSPDEYVFFSVYVEDQLLNPYSGSVNYAIYHNDNEISEGWWDYSTDDGYIDWGFDPSDYYTGEFVNGIYMINVTNAYEESIGNNTFVVVDVDMDITPPNPPYAQGEELSISILTSITGTIDVHILDPEGEALSDANWTDQELINGQWGKSYTLGTNLLDGNYEIQILKDGNIMESMGITVKKYTLQIWTDAEAYLPGETMTVLYTITHNKDSSGITDVDLEWIFEYFDVEDFEFKNIPNSKPSAGAYGSFLVPIPESASNSNQAKLHIWANDTSDRSDDLHENINIGEIFASIIIDDDKYMAGDFVIVTINGYIDSGNNPLRDGDVHLEVSKEGIEITAYTTDGLKTDSQGTLTYILPLQNDAETGSYTIAINVSKENEWNTAQEIFEVVENREMSLELGFNRMQYYSGDSVTVTYTALRGEEIVQNVNCEYQVSYEGNYITAGISSSGEFTFDIPGDFKGALTVEVEGTDSEGYMASSTANINVARAGLLLQPNMNEYLPGDTVRVDYHVVGNEISNANSYYEIKDERVSWDPDDDIIIKRGILTSSSGYFQFTVPENNVPDSYTINGYITDSSGVVLAQSSVVVTRLQGFMLTFTLDKNTYRPGETATLHYKVISIDGSEIPEKFTLQYGYGVSSGPYRTIETSEDHGSLTLKVPKDASDGTGYFYIFSDLPYGENGHANAQQQANIRANPNPFAENVFGDSSLLELILIVFVIIALYFGITGWRMGKRALEQAKLPPWKKESALPEPDKFKGNEPGKSEDSEQEKSPSPETEKTEDSEQEKSSGPEPGPEPITPPIEEESTPPPPEA